MEGSALTPSTPVLLVVCVLPRGWERERQRGREVIKSEDGI